ncbi:hypothetical protein QE152_g7004 [Popillia japonica]|uniref:Uncharacterized protein n=1 Tax=Popillia japonica TaxID=7064 RepID=A0AAW1MF53_POPJA
MEPGMEEKMNIWMEEESTESFSTVEDWTDSPTSFSAPLPESSLLTNISAAQFSTIPQDDILHIWTKVKSQLIVKISTGHHQLTLILLHRLPIANSGGGQKQIPEAEFVLIAHPHYRRIVPSFYFFHLLPVAA